MNAYSQTQGTHANRHAKHAIRDNEGTHTEDIYTKSRWHTHTEGRHEDTHTQEAGGMYRRPAGVNTLRQESRLADTQREDRQAHTHRRALNAHTHTQAGTQAGR